jgi:hypothetical protein
MKKVIQKLLCCALLLSFEASVGMDHPSSAVFSDSSYSNLGKYAFLAEYMASVGGSRFADNSIGEGLADLQSEEAFLDFASKNKEILFVGFYSALIENSSLVLDCLKDVVKCFDQDERRSLFADILLSTESPEEIVKTIECFVPYVDGGINATCTAALPGNTEFAIILDGLNYTIDCYVLNYSVDECGSRVEKLTEVKKLVEGKFPEAKALYTKSPLYNKERDAKQSCLAELRRQSKGNE